MDALGPYRVLEIIGQGGMGTVWEAEHSIIGRRVAIKILRAEFCANYTVVHRFFNEARAASMVADPGIVQVFDFGQVDGRAFIVMELLEGEPLDARLKRFGRLSPSDAVRLMIQVAGSLGSVHAHGIIHRDLKPENIFIVGDPTVTGGERTKLLDFGIAKLSTDEQSTVKTRTGVVIGTPVYMSPEQCRGNSELDHRSDIYAFGCVLFNMVCGRPPFESQGSGDLIIKHVCDVPPRPSELAPIPAGLEAVILKCLAKAPGDRYQSMADVIQALEGLHAELFAQPEQPAWIPPTDSVRNRPAPTTLGAAASQVSPEIIEPPRKRVSWVAGAIAMVGIAAGGIYVFGFAGSSPSLDAPSGATHVLAPISATPPEAKRDPSVEAKSEPGVEAKPDVEQAKSAKPGTEPVVIVTMQPIPAKPKPAAVAPVAQPKPAVTPVAQPKPAAVAQPKPATAKPVEQPKPAAAKPVAPKPEPKPAVQPKPVKPPITDRGD